MTSKTLLELSKSDPTPDTDEQRGRDGHIMRVVQWIDDDGNPIKSGPQLHKQVLYLNDEGAVRPGKQKGFTRKDWKLIKDNFDKIDALLTEPESDDE